MAFSLGPVGQIALNVADADRSEAFYGGVLGLRKLFRFGGLAFFEVVWLVGAWPLLSLSVPG